MPIRSCGKCGKPRTNYDAENCLARGCPLKPDLTAIVAEQDRLIARATISKETAAEVVKAYWPTNKSESAEVPADSLKPRRGRPPKAKE